MSHCIFLFVVFFLFYIFFVSFFLYFYREKSIENEYTTCAVDNDGSSKKMRFIWVETMNDTYPTHSDNNGAK